MRRIYTSSNFVLVGQLEEILSRHGIGTFVKNKHLYGAIGELPEFECWPELWVTADEDLERARDLVRECTEVPAATGPSWQCAHCFEDIEPPFESCWNCGSDRPERDRECES